MEVQQSAELWLTEVTGLKKAADEILARHKELEEYYHSVEMQRGAKGLSQAGFTVVIIGEEKVGKSSLLKTLLPKIPYDGSFASGLPMLTHIVNVEEGMTPSLVLRTTRQERLFPIESGMSTQKLSEFVKSKLNELLPQLSHDEYVEAWLSIPLPYGSAFNVVDTPSLMGSLACRRAVRAAIQEADLIIITFLATSGGVEDGTMEEVMSRHALHAILLDLTHVLG